jgi:hypothetical protein
MSIMGSRLEDQTFKNREQVKAEVRKCALYGDVCQYLSFIFVALGVIGGAWSQRLGFCWQLLLV